MSSHVDFLQSHSDVYKYDLSLCKIIETNQAFSEIYLVHAERPLHIGIEGPKFDKIINERPEDLTNERIYAIVCRWQGLRILQDLYLNAAIGAKYSNFTFSYSMDANRVTTAMLTESAINDSHLQHLPAQDLSSRSFNAQQTQRFYKALTSYWLAMESHWLLCRSVHSTWEELWKLIGSVRDIWRGGHRRDLLESCELIEVYDFVYGFLLETIFPNIETTLPWLGGSDWYRLGTNNASESLDWAYFVQNCRRFLNPAHVIELLALPCSSTGMKWPPNKTEYLQRRGAFQASCATAQINPPDCITVYFSHDVQMLEKDTCCKLEAKGHVDDADRFRALWKNFRDAWTLHARWTLFWWADSSDDVVAYIQERETNELGQERQPSPDSRESTYF